MEFVVHDQGPLAGIEEAIAGLGERPDAKTLEATARSLQAAGVPVRQTLGSWPTLSRLVDWVRGRELLRELPVETVEVPWFAVHVPVAGSAQVKAQSRQSDTASAGLKLFGSGYSRGRDFKIEVTEESNPRTVCTHYSIDVRVLPRLYSYKNAESIAIEVLGAAGTRIKSDEQCARCRLAPDAIDRFENVLEEFLDLRRDTVKQRRTIALSWAGKHSFDIAANLPSTKLPIVLNASMSSEALWQVTYELSPGFLYQPYRSLEAAKYLPPMWAFSA